MVYLGELTSKQTMSLVRFHDCVKGDLSSFREGMLLYHSNRQGIFKDRNKDLISCFNQGCTLCYECTTFKCFMCGHDMWECSCGVCNVRKNPHLRELHPEEYLSFVYSNWL